MSNFKFEWVEQYLKREPKVVFDVGTWDGADAIALKQRWPRADVYAFEACPDNYAAAFKSGGVKAAGVMLVHAAVGAEDRDVPFYSNTDTALPKNPGMSGSTLFPSPALIAIAPNLTFLPPRMVRGIRLDTFCRMFGVGPIDILHMDVQGAEDYVMGGLGVLPRPAMVFMEIDATQLYEDAVPVDLLRAHMREDRYTEVWTDEHDALFIYEPTRKPHGGDHQLPPPPVS